MEDGDDDNDTNFSNQNPGFSQFEDKNNGEFFIKFSLIFPLIFKFSRRLF